VDEWFERSPFAGFAPWIIYWVVANGPSTWMFGAICAVIAALILGVSAGRGGPRVLEVVTIVFFIAVYAPESALQEDWEKAAFRRTNRVLTLMWALVFALIAVLGYVAVQSPASIDWTKAVIPVVVIVGAMGMTQMYPTRARESAKPA
jgi:peptidoglycan/LPS O-acetylase OafA/YrhL